MRTPDQHLTAEELAMLSGTAPFNGSTMEQRASAEEHVHRCAECTGLVQTQHELARLAGNPPADAPATDSCAGEQVWLEYAAGLRGEEAFRLTAHASQCSHCAAHLKDALHLMRAVPAEHFLVPEEAGALESSRREWQQKLAARMAAQRIASARSAKQSAFWKRPRWSLSTGWLSFAAPALAGVVLLAAGALVWRQVHPTDARLLAEAYNRQRTLPLRIAGAEPVPLASITRSGGAGAEGRREPSQLIELRLRAQQNLEKTPESPYWHQVMGEINLLDRDAASARRNLEIAEASDASLPGLQPDLAAAWFELGETTGDAVDYTHATEFYLRELRSLNDGKRHPQSASVLHYNLALCWERLNVTQSALSELHAALAAEKSTAWRDAIQDEINRLSAHSQLTGDPLDQDGYEAAVMTAIDAVGANPAAAASSATLQAAGLGLAHGDPWITDWTHPARLLKMHEADAHLAAATRGGVTGDNAAGLREGQLAIEAYRNARNIAGMLRAQYAVLYAQQRLGLDKDCRQLAGNVEKAPESRRYPLLRARVLLMEAACAGRDHDYAVADPVLGEAIALSRQHHLPQALLYGVNARIAMLHEHGDNSASLREDVAAQHLCSEIRCDANRRYTFLLLMMYATDDLGLRLTGEAAMQAGAEVAQGAGDIMSRCYAWESLGRSAVDVGDFAVAEHAFKRASDVAAEQHTPVADVYRADWELDRAGMLTRESRPADALRVIEKNSHDMLATTYVPGLTKLHQQGSLAQLALGHADDAVKESLAATQVTERALASLDGNTLAREQWAREQMPIYRQLVRAFLAEGRNTEALLAWERFRSLAAEPAISATPIKPAAADRPEPTGTARLLPASLTSSPEAAGAQVIVIARAGDVYVGWRVLPDGRTVVRTAILGAADALQQQARTLYHLCADRDSRVVDLQHVGAMLFEHLLAPLLDTGATAPHTLFVDLDPTLSELSLEALLLPGGDWLSSRYDVSVLPAWWSLRPQQSLALSPIRREGRALLVDGLDSQSVEGSELAAIAPQLPSAVRLTGPALTSAALRSTLPNASLFHFSGHTDLSGTALLRAGTGSEPVLTPQTMNGLRLPHCRLAVLAACNTNASDPELVEKAPDLRNTLLLAGAERVIASNWDVDDRSTRSLMVAFYQGLEHGRIPAQALAEAQRTIRSQNGWQHPYYWAGFELFTR